jgi:hypothetical protein
MGVQARSVHKLIAVYKQGRALVHLLDGRHRLSVRVGTKVRERFCRVVARVAEHKSRAREALHPLTRGERKKTEKKVTVKVAMLGVSVENGGACVQRERWNMYHGRDGGGDRGAAWFT